MTSLLFCFYDVNVIFKTPANLKFPNSDRIKLKFDLGVDFGALISKFN